MSNDTEQAKTWICKQIDMPNLHQQAWLQKGLKKAVVMHTLDAWSQKQSAAELNLEIFPAVEKSETLVRSHNVPFYCFSKCPNTKHI